MLWMWKEVVMGYLKVTSLHVTQWRKRVRRDGNSWIWSRSRSRRANHYTTACHPPPGNDTNPWGNLKKCKSVPASIQFVKKKTCESESSLHESFILVLCLIVRGCNIVGQMPVRSLETCIVETLTTLSSSSAAWWRRTLTVIGLHPLSW